MSLLFRFLCLFILFSASAQAKDACVVKPEDRVQAGLASWYGPSLDGGRTSDGEYFDRDAFTAAHRTLPMNTKLRVTNRRNGKSVVVRVNDRGPQTPGRLIDVSEAAAEALDMLQSGTALVRVRVLCREEPRGLILVRPKKKPG